MANLQKGISAVRVYDENDTPIMIVKISEQCRRTREIMKGDYIRLSWESDEFRRLGTGCHIYYGTAELDKSNPAFYLLNPYEPTRKAEECYTYEPEFHAREDLWRKYPACIYTYGATRDEIKGRELEWSFLGTPQDALSVVEQSVLNETGWRLEPSVIGSVKEKGSSAIDLQAQSMSIYDMLGQIAEILDTEWRYDTEQNAIILGEHRLDTDHYPVITLKVGVDCDNPQVNQANEDYFNRFYIYGSDKNIQQQQIEEISNSAVKKRLPLDSARYPGGFMDLDILGRKDLEGNEKDGWNLPKGAVYTPTQTDKSKIFPKGLYFDDVYPSTKFFIKSILKNGSDHKQFLRDENGNIIGDTYYVAVSIDIKSDNIWDGFDPSKVLPGETLVMYWTSGILNGRSFSLSVHQAYFRGNTYFYLTPDQNGALTTPNQYLCPSVGDEVTFLGYDFGEAGYDSARMRLERTATKHLYEMVQNNKTYTIKGNVPRFERNCARDVRFASMPLGQQIVIDYGNGDVSDLLRVTKVSGALDIPSEMSVTAAAKTDPKGAISSLTETVELNKRTAERKIEEYRQQAITYAQRNITQVYETMTQVNNYFEGEIKTTQNMQSVTGQAALQIVFSETKDFKTLKNPSIYWAMEKNPPCLAMQMYPSDEEYFYVKHMTLGVTDITSSARMDRQRMVWRLRNQYTEWENDDNRVAYLRCSKTTANGERPTADNPGAAVLVLADKREEMEDGDYYMFLLGFLSGADGTGARSFSPMYGYTEILPGQINTSMIMSDDGQTYFDLKNGKIGGNIDFQGNLSLETIYIKNGQVDPKGKPFYIGGLSGAQGLPTIWTGLEPTTDTAEVDANASKTDLPLKIAKEGIGSNIGPLRVVDKDTVDVDNTEGFTRITRRSIVEENRRLSPVQIPNLYLKIENPTNLFTLTPTNYDPVSKAVEVGRVRACSGVSATLEVSIPTFSYTYDLRWVYKSGLFKRYKVKCTLVLSGVFQYSTDNCKSWSDLSSAEFSKEVEYNQMADASSGTAPSLFFVGKRMQIDVTDTLHFRFLFRFEELQPSFSSKKTVSRTYTGKLKGSNNNNPITLLAKKSATIIGDGGITSAIDGNNFFKLYPSGGKLTMEFRGGMVVEEDREETSEGYYVLCRNYGNITYIKCKVKINSDGTGEPTLKRRFAPSEEIDFITWGGISGTLTEYGNWKLSATSGTCWLCLTYIRHN